MCLCRNLGPLHLPSCLPLRLFPRNAGPQALAALSQTCNDQRLSKTQAPPEIPLEDVQEYMNIMDELLKTPTVEEARKEPEEEAGHWSHPQCPELSG